jgi:hypothetical protein
VYFGDALIVLIDYVGFGAAANRVGVFIFKAEDEVTVALSF